MHTRFTRSEEGFTLIELLVVIVIIGVLAAIALPIFINQQKAAGDAKVKADIKNAATALISELNTLPYGDASRTREVIYATAGFSANWSVDLKMVNLTTSPDVYMYVKRNKITKEYCIEAYSPSSGQYDNYDKRTYFDSTVGVVGKTGEVCKNL